MPARRRFKARKLEAACVCYDIYVNKISTPALIGTIVILAIIGGLIFALAANNNQQELLSISSFAECAGAGYPIKESYPERCTTPDGRSFVNESQSSDPLPPRDLTLNGCAVAGCSGELCVSAEEAKSVVTTCEFKAEYVCYKGAVCERGAGGKCGWRQTQELRNCLANPGSVSGDIEAVY